MSVVLPQSIDYTKSHPALPDTTNMLNIAAAPSNGNSFTQNNQIMIDLVQRGFLIPESMYFSYQIDVAGATAGTTYVINNPAYQPIARLDTVIGSSSYDTIQNYNTVMGSLLSNTQLSVAEKYGCQSMYGWGGDISGVQLENLDGRLLGSATESYTVAAPLVCLLSNAEKLIPLFALPQIRVIFTLDSIANIYGSANLPTSYTITNFQFRYKVLDFGGNIEDMVAKMSPDGKFYIKSQSFACSSQTLPANSQGYQELIFNTRLASIKSLFAVNGSGKANKQFESFDLTKGQGDYSFNIGGVMYPSIPLSSKTNRAGILAELKSAVGSIYARNNAFSINTAEFKMNENDSSFYNVPAKFFVGTSVEKLDSQSNAILSGVSSQNSPISYRINLGGATTSANSTVSLIINYDALLEVDVVNRQCTVKQ